MAPVQSRLVLAVTIPAAALAIFLSLFWLRRSSKGHPPSPPDIPIKKKKEELKFEDSCKDEPCKGDTVETDPCVDLALNTSSESVNISQIENTSDSAYIDSPVLLKSELESYTDFNIVEEVLLKDKSILLVEECPLKDPSDTCKGEEVKIDKVDIVEVRFACGDKLLEEQEIVVNNNIAEVTAEVKADTLEEKDISPVVGDLEENIIALECKKIDSPVQTPLQTETVTEIDKSDSKSSVDTKMIEETGTTLKLDYHKETDVEKSDLSEKLANLELGTMKLGDVDAKERDSANHSPSENMLASPSMSNFSDAHSEGSSDSGKGHSDGTTSPSRTPAGGSSVSGDPSPSVYEFVIPQSIVGRLIGRHGVFLNEIMSETHTSIFIKVHPETSKLKICAIEGSQQDIEKALKKIRQKFPLRRYPKLTLERVSFVQYPSQQLRPEDFYLQLIEGLNNDVILSSLLNPGQFFVQQPCHPTYPCLTLLTQTLSQTYSTTDAPPLVRPVADAICVCPSLGGWYRAQVISVDEDASQCDIKFVDYGGYLRVEASLLKQIRADFLMLPFQAVECSLANVQPIDESGWSEEARLFIHNLTFGRILQARIVSYNDSGVPLVNLYTAINNQVVLVNAELVSNQFATLLVSSESGEDNSETIPDQVTV